MTQPSSSHPLFAQRLSLISESETLKLNALVQQMKKDGVDVINLTAGEPDFFVPESSKKAVEQALRENRSKYTAVPGITELRDAIAVKTNRQHQWQASKDQWTAQNVMVSNGGKQALFNFFMSFINPGDEVLIPTPYWLSYPEMVKVFEGQPRFIRTTFDSGFKMSPNDLEKAISKKTKVLVMNSPSNPTGIMYSREELAELGRVLDRHPQVLVVSDEIYDRIILTGLPFTSFLAAAPQLRERCLTVNGMSKSAAMTGWRIGWAVGPESWIKAMTKLQGQSTSGINALAQWASLDALQLPESAFSTQVEAYRRRRDLLLGILAKCGKIKVIPPAGAFYAFIGVDACLRGQEDSVSFAEALLQEAKVAVVPGHSFGEPHFVRLSFATDERSLQEGCERLVAFVQKRLSRNP